MLCSDDSRDYDDNQDQCTAPGCEYQFAHTDLDEPASYNLASC